MSVVCVCTTYVVVVKKKTPEEVRSEREGDGTVPYRVSTLH